LGGLMGLETMSDRHQDEITVLTTQVNFLDEEIKSLRTRLVGEMKLQKKIVEVENSLTLITAQNENLAAALREARDYIITLTEENERLQTTVGNLADAEDRSGIFITHGHDERLKLEVARLLETVTGEEVTVLAERPNRGQTVIEKLQQYAKVRFSVILMTPDDQMPSETGQSVSGRARQNVILELGLFIGLLGRDNVCVLYKPGTEIPSDYHGVLLIEADDRGAWKVDLLRELQASGITINWQRI
jgi:predicted nucleotide-binding protein